MYDLRKLNCKMVENNSLVNQILKIKNEYVNKQNEIFDMYEHAQKKTEVIVTLNFSGSGYIF